MVLMELLEKRGCLDNQGQGVERVYLDLQALWDKKETRGEMDTGVSQGDLARRESRAKMDKSEKRGWWDQEEHLGVEKEGARVPLALRVLEGFLVPQALQERMDSMGLLESQAPPDLWEGLGCLACQGRRVLLGSRGRRETLGALAS